METHPIGLWSLKGKEVSLYDVVEDLILKSSDQAAENGNIISNEITNDIQVSVDTGKLKGLLKKILELIIKLTRKMHTYISAKIYSNLVLVQFKEDHLENVSPVINHLKQMQPVAESLGGYIGITSENFNFTTISLTVLNTKNSPGTHTNHLTKVFLGKRQQRKNRKR